VRGGFDDPGGGGLQTRFLTNPITPNPITPNINTHSHNKTITTHTQYLSFVYWGFNLLLKIEFSGREFINCSSDKGQPLKPCEPVADLQAALSLPTSPNASPALDIGVLFGMLVLLRVCIYIALRKKTKAS